MENNNITIEQRLDRIESLLTRLLEGSKPVKEVMNVREVSEYLGVTPGYVRNLVCQGRIPHGKNGHNFFRKSEIDAWRYGHRIKTDEELREKITKAV